MGIFVLGLSLLSACTLSDPSGADLDEAAIYAVLIRQLYEVDDTYGGTLRAPIVYVVSRTDDSVGDPENDRVAPVNLAETLQGDIVVALADLPAEFLWVANQRDVALNPDTGQVTGDGVIITMGNIHLQKDGSVQVSGSIYIASLAAGGQTYLLQQQDGQWTVVGTTGVQWIS